MQIAITITIVAIAAAYLAYKAYKALRHACNGRQPCEGCPMKQACERKIKN